MKIRRPQAMKGLAPDASIRTIPVFLLIAAVCAPCLCAGPSAFQAHASRSPAQFKLVRNRRSFSLAFTSKGVTKQIVIPRQWLVPPKEEADEELNAFVLSFNYDSEVQSFEIGDGRIGLHLSSFESGDEGSSRAAAGRDVFLTSLRIGAPHQGRSGPFKINMFDLLSTIFIRLSFALSGSFFARKQPPI